MIYSNHCESRLVPARQRYTLLCFFNHFTIVTSVGGSHRYSIVHFLWVRVRVSSIHDDKHNNVGHPRSFTRNLREHSLHFPQPSLASPVTYGCQGSPTVTSGQVADIHQRIPTEAAYAHGFLFSMVTNHERFQTSNRSRYR